MGSNRWKLHLASVSNQFEKTSKYTQSDEKENGRAKERDSYIFPSLNPKANSIERTDERFMQYQHKMPVFREKFLS